MSLLNHLFSKETKAESNEEKSFLDLRIRINEELLMKILSWLLAGSIAGGGAYALSNMTFPSNAEPNLRQIPEQHSLVEEVD